MGDQRCHIKYASRSWLTAGTHEVNSLSPLFPTLTQKSFRLGRQSAPFRDPEDSSKENQPSIPTQRVTGMKLEGLLLGVFSPSQPWCLQDSKQLPSSKEGPWNTEDKGAFRLEARP